MSKAMWRIVPLILLGYMVSYMDRVNVSFASLQMNDDLKFSATVYGLGAGLFFLGYALFEVPSSMMLARFSAPFFWELLFGLLAVGAHLAYFFLVARRRRQDAQREAIEQATRIERALARRS